VLAGAVRRAPRWMQSARLEWFFSAESAASADVAPLSVNQHSIRIPDDA